MKATRNGRPSVVLPNVRRLTRGLALSRAVKYSVTSFQLGRCRSAPGSKPRIEAGDGMGSCAAPCGCCAWIGVDARMRAEKSARYGDMRVAPRFSGWDWRKVGAGSAAWKAID